MFGLKKSSNPEEELPLPPSTEDILEDLKKAGPDDVVFTTNIGDLSANLDQASRSFQLQKRFQVFFFSNLCNSLALTLFETTFDLCAKKMFDLNKLGHISED